MSSYQAVAENGPRVCQGVKKLVECGDNVAGLPPADGLILNDFVPGYGVNAIRSIHGGVTNDEAALDRNRPVRVDRRLDPFDPKNGYNPNRSSRYTEDFKKRYFEAQAKRMNLLIEEALENWTKLKRRQAERRCAFHYEVSDS